MRKGQAALWVFACSIVMAVLLIIWPVGTEEAIETAVVQSGELVRSVLMTGTVQYARQYPCVALKNGTICEVYAEPGARVQSGDLLFVFDTQAEEQALASLYEMKYEHRTSLNALDGAVSALAWQSEMDWISNEKQLRASIEASVIRANSDGVVDAVYNQPGDYVSTASVLGVVRGDEQQIIASAAGLAGVYPGMAAIARIGEDELPLVLEQISAPDEHSGNQLYCFEALEQVSLAEMGQGKMVEIEMTTEICPTSALVPLSAVDADGTLWLVRNGRAYQHKISLECCNRNYAAAPLELTGETVILYPEEHEWKDGMRVR